MYNPKSGNEVWTSPYDESAVRLLSIVTLLRLFLGTECECLAFIDEFMITDYDVLNQLWNKPPAKSSCSIRQCCQPLLGTDSRRRLSLSFLGSGMIQQ